MTMLASTAFHDTNQYIADCDCMIDKCSPLFNMHLDSDVATVVYTFSNIAMIQLTLNDFAGLQIANVQSLKTFVLLCSFCPSWVIQSGASLSFKVVRWSLFVLAVAK
jgi:hypothetical protein